MPLSSAIRATVGILLVVPFLSGCGLVFVNGPPTGWQEVEDADELEMLAITQPCTTSKTLVLLDGLASAWSISNAIYAADAASEPGSEYQTHTNALVNAITGAITAFGALRGNQKINDCRVFNARLLELRGGDAVGQATYNWLDEFSPIPDFGIASQNLLAIIPPVRGFSPAFSGSISNSPEH